MRQKKKKVDEGGRREWGEVQWSDPLQKKTAVPQAPPFTEPLS